MKFFQRHLTSWDKRTVDEKYLEIPDIGSTEGGTPLINKKDLIKQFEEIPAATTTVDKKDKGAANQIGGSHPWSWDATDYRFYWWWVQGGKWLRF